MADEERPSIRIMFLGDMSIGKTCAIRTYVEDEFPTDAVQTIFDVNDDKTVTVKDVVYQLVIIDTGGEANNQNYRKSSFANIDCFVICFRVDSAESLRSTHLTWLDELKLESEITDPVPKILVGLRTDSDMRVVSEEQAKEI